METIASKQPFGSKHANILVTAGVLDPAAAVTELHLGDGRVLRVATAALERAEETSAPSEAWSLADAEPIAGGDAEATVPVFEEQLQVGRRTVSTGKVRLQKTVESYDAVVDEPLAMRTFEVERVPINRPVAEAPAVRQEGNTTIYPVVEEQAVVTVQLLLKEEIRVTQRDEERHDPQTVTLRRERVDVEREG